MSMRGKVKDYIDRERNHHGFEDAVTQVLDAIRDCCKTQDDIETMVAAMRDRAQSFSHDEILS